MPLPPMKGHTSSVRSVAFNHDGTRVVSGSDDTTHRPDNLAAHSAIFRPPLSRGHQNNKKIDIPDHPKAGAVPEHQFFQGGLAQFWGSVPRTIKIRNKNFLPAFLKGNR